MRSGAVGCGLVLPVATGFLPVVIDVERSTGRKPVPTGAGRPVGCNRARRALSGPRGGHLPGYRFEPVGELGVRPLAVKLRSG